jgi:hypothetical protein
MWIVNHSVEHKETGLSREEPLQLTELSWTKDWKVHLIL